MKTFHSSFEGRINIKNELLLLSEKVREYTGGEDVKTYIPKENIDMVKTKLQSFEHINCQSDGYNYAVHSYFEEEKTTGGKIEMIELSIDIL